MAVTQNVGTRNFFPRSNGWFVYVSLPVYQFMLFRWLFRIFVWSRFLWQVSRLDLHLVPTHPDRADGLGFVINKGINLSRKLPISLLFNQCYKPAAVFGGTALCIMKRQSKAMYLWTLNSGEFRRICSSTLK
jgi:hypothetical protein